MSKPGRNITIWLSRINFVIKFIIMEVFLWHLGPLAMHCWTLCWNFILVVKTNSLVDMLWHIFVTLIPSHFKDAKFIEMLKCLWNSTFRVIGLQIQLGTFILRIKYVLWNGITYTLNSTALVYLCDCNFSFLNSSIVFSIFIFYPQNEVVTKR